MIEKGKMQETLGLLNNPNKKQLNKDLCESSEKPKLCETWILNIKPVHILSY